MSDTDTEPDEFIQQLGLYNRTRLWLHNYFGYKEDWVTIPIDTRVGLWWYINGAQDDTGLGGEVVFEYNDPYSPQVVEDGACVREPIYTQRFLPRWIYRGEDYTMICVNTQVDGNKYLAIFSNDCEVKDVPAHKSFDEEVDEAIRNRGMG